MELTIDLGPGPQGASPDPVKAGRYIVRILSVREGTSADGAPKLGVQFRILRGDYAGRMLWATLIIAPATLGRLRAFLAAIGESSQGNIDIDTRRWIGRTIVVKVEIELVDGKNRNVIRKFLPTTATCGKQARTTPTDHNELTHGQ